MGLSCTCKDAWREEVKFGGSGVKANIPMLLDKVRELCAEAKSIGS